MKYALIVALVVTLTGEAVAQTAQTAEDLYTQGQEAYDRKSYGEAIERWKESYELSHEDALYFNIAQAQRLSGDCRSAIESYRRFLASASASDADQQKLASDFVGNLEESCAPPPPPPSEVGAVKIEDRTDRPAPTKQAQGGTLRTSGIAIGGASIIVLATGLYLGHHAQTIGDEVTGACRVSCDWGAWKEKDATGQRYARIGRGLFVGGAIGIAGGAFLYYLGVRQGSLTVEPRMSGGGGTVSWSGSW